MFASSTGSGPLPNGSRPVAAYASTAPQENTSLGGPTSARSNCSGDMKPKVPTVCPVAVSVVIPETDAMPKSITRGPATASSTFDGLRSRCTNPAAWMPFSATARPPASRPRVRSGSAPYRSTASPSGMPGMYAVASHGMSACASAATTAAV